MACEQRLAAIQETQRTTAAHWRSMDHELPSTSEDVVVVARHLDGFDTVLGYDDGEWFGEGGSLVYLSEYYAWTLVSRCNLPVPLDAQAGQGVGDA